MCVWGRTAPPLHLLKTPEEMKGEEAIGDQLLSVQYLSSSEPLCHQAESGTPNLFSLDQTCSFTYW